MSKSEKSRETEKNEFIYQHKDKLIQAVRENTFLVVTGETGSGKSTQLSQCLYKAGNVIPLNWSWHASVSDLFLFFSMSVVFLLFFAGLVWLSPGGFPRGCPMRWGSGWVRRCASMTALQRYEITLLFNTSTFVSQKQRYKSCNRGSAFLKVTLLYILFYL